MTVTMHNIHRWAGLPLTHQWVLLLIRLALAMEHQDIKVKAVIPRLSDSLIHLIQHSQVDIILKFDLLKLLITYFVQDIHHKVVTNLKAIHSNQDLLQVIIKKTFNQLVYQNKILRQGFHHNMIPTINQDRVWDSPAMIQQESL